MVANNSKVRIALGNQLMLLLRTEAGIALLPLTTTSPIPIQADISSANCCTESAAAALSSLPVYSNQQQPTAATASSNTSIRQFI